MSIEFYETIFWVPVIITWGALLTSESGSYRQRVCLTNIFFGWILWCVHWTAPVAVAFIILSLPGTIKGEIKAANKIKSSKSFNIQQVL